VNGIDGLNPDFRDMVAALCDAGAEFLVVGAFAVSFHGHPRTTGDMDVWVRPSAANASRVIAALTDFGAPIAALGIVAEDFERSDVVVQIGVAPRRIDLLTGISGVAFDEAWPTRVTVDWNGRQVAFLGFEELLRNKRASGRAKDLLDVEELERRRAGGS